MTGKALREWLDAPGEARSLVREARRLLALQQAFAECVPGPLARASRVRAVREGILVISADNGAVAGKLRQFTATLLARLGPLGRGITQVRVIVEAQTRPSEPPPKTAVLSEAALATLDELARTLPESPLRAALSRMVCRHRGARR